MPAFEMTADEQAKYGDKLSIWQQLALLQSWLPMLTFLQRFMATNDPNVKKVVVLEMAEWLASRTDSTLDDELVKYVAAALMTQEGENLVRWAVGKVQRMKA